MSAGNPEPRTLNSEPRSERLFGLGLARPQSEKGSALREISISNSQHSNPISKGGGSAGRCAVFHDSRVYSRQGPLGYWIFLVGLLDILPVFGISVTLTLFGYGLATGAVLVDQWAAGFNQKARPLCPIHRGVLMGIHSRGPQS
jgi:hypothetical protein